MHDPGELLRRDLLVGSIPTLGLVGGLLGAGGIFGGTAHGQEGHAGNQAIHNTMMNSFKDGAYTLPPLPYGYDALEPHIDRETMTLHHDKHHQAYVDGLNKTLKTMSDLRGAGGELNPSALSGLQEDLAFHGSGHILHAIFWATMAPGAGGAPQGSIASALQTHFGSFAAFQAHFSTAAAAVKGSGWGVLVYEPVGDKLLVLQVKQHDLQTVFGCIPLLPLDVWEHAYYVKYRNVRADYIKAWWNVVNWPAVDGLYTFARRMFGRS